MARLTRKNAQKLDFDAFLSFLDDDSKEVYRIEDPNNPYVEFSITKFPLLPSLYKLFLSVYSKLDRGNWKAATPGMIPFGYYHAETMDLFLFNNKSIPNSVLVAFPDQKFLYIKDDYALSDAMESAANVEIYKQMNAQHRFRYPGNPNNASFQGSAYDNNNQCDSVIDAQNKKWITAVKLACMCFDREQALKALVTKNERPSSFSNNVFYMNHHIQQTDELDGYLRNQHDWAKNTATKFIVDHPQFGTGATWYEKVQDILAQYDALVASDNDVRCIREIVANIPVGKKAVKTLEIAYLDDQGTNELTGTIDINELHFLVKDIYEANHWNYGVVRKFGGGKPIVDNLISLSCKGKVIYKK